MVIYFRTNVALNNTQSGISFFKNGILNSSFQAKRAFESWNEMKQEDNKVKNTKRTELMNKELEKKKEQNLRARDAKKYFESWKAKKDEELKEQHQKKKGEERNKKKKDEEKEKEKSVDSQKAFENW